MGKLKFQNIKFIHPHIESFYVLCNEQDSPCPPSIYSLVSGRGGVQTMSIWHQSPWSFTTQRTGVQCKSNLGLKTRIPAAHMRPSAPCKVPLSYFRQSQGCLACSPEQAQSALKAHIPCQTLSLSADSHIYGCVLCQRGDCLPSCPVRTPAQSPIVSQNFGENLS